MSSIRGGGGWWYCSFVSRSRLVLVHSWSYSQVHAGLVHFLQAVKDFGRALHGGSHVVAGRCPLAVQVLALEKIR
jgi:hypothetical protein